MLYRWCEPKMKKKTATFLNIKKKKLQNEKKKIMLLISCLCQKWRKRITTFLIISRKKITNIEKKGFHLYVVMGKKSLGEHFDHLPWKLC